MGVFERVLVALRERIPIKLEHEDVMKSSRGSGGGKQRDKVDVFRGSERFPSLSLSLSRLLRKRQGASLVVLFVCCTADYQMAFFFRTTNDKHVVLLKVNLRLSFRLRADGAHRRLSECLD